MKKLFIFGLSLATISFIVLLASLAAGFDQASPALANSPAHAGHNVTSAEPVNVKIGNQPITGSFIEVDIQDFAFAPKAFPIPLGTAVRWTNRGNAPHTVTDLKGAFDSGTINPGESFVFTFTTPGFYDYKCNIHLGMFGRILVESPPAQLISLNPNTKPAGSSGFTLQVQGSGFVSDSLVTFNNSFVQSSRFVNSNLMTATIFAHQLTTPITFSVSVTHPAYTSPPNSLIFTITDTTVPCQPSTALTVTKTTDDGACGTLRWAVQEAALSSSPVTISFSIVPGSIITLTSPLTIPVGTTIDGGCSEEGPVFNLNGNNLDNLLLGNGVKLIGLNIYGFRFTQIYTAFDSNAPTKFYCTRVRGNT